LDVTENDDDDAVELDRCLLEEYCWCRESVLWDDNEEEEGVPLLSPLKFTELIAVVASVILFVREEEEAEAAAPPPPPLWFLRILRIPLELVELITTELALCTIPSLVPNGRNNTTMV
jgi:hypothetical protein